MIKHHYLSTTEPSHSITICYITSPLALEDVPPSPCGEVPEVPPPVPEVPLSHSRCRVVDVTWGQTALILGY